jgi:transcriptional regulator with XRE-family HTH domain
MSSSMKMKVKSMLDEFLEDRQNRREFVREELAFAATELVSELMEKEGISKAELAKRIGKSKAYVTQVLSASRNMTMHTLAELAYVLGYRIELRASPAVQVEYRYEGEVSLCQTAINVSRADVQTAGEAAVLAPQQAPHQLAA